MGNFKGHEKLAGIEIGRKYLDPGLQAGYVVNIAQLRCHAHCL